MDSTTAYCPSCREEYPVRENPPYAVRHVRDDEGNFTHFHPVTGEALTYVVVA